MSYTTLAILSLLFITNAYGQFTTPLINGNNPQYSIKEMISLFPENDNLVMTNNNTKSTSSLFWDWNIVSVFNEQNSLSEKHTQTFEANGHVLIRLKEIRVNNAWVNEIRNIYTYNTNGTLLTVLEEQWLSNAWWNKEKRTSSYYTNGTPMTETVEEWTNNAWENNSRCKLINDQFQVVKS